MYAHPKSGRCIGTAAVFLSAMLLRGCAPSASDEADDLPAPGQLFGSTSTRKIDVDIKGIKMKVPLNYISTLDKDGIFAQALLPDLSPRTKDNDYLMRSGKADMVSMLIRKANKNSLWASYDVYINVKKQYDTYYEKNINLTCNRVEEYGENFYTCGNNGLKWPMTTLLYCYAIGSGPRPHCTQWFIHRGLYFDITYPIQYLYDWSRIQKMVEAKIDSFLADAGETAR